MNAATDHSMDFPIPRFRKGDKVWHAWTDTAAASHPCPDCRDTKVWTCTSPAGHTMEMQCPRCDRNTYNDKLDLRYTRHTFGVRELTIGSIRINTDNVHGDHPVSYMCIETGVGSGSVYYEDQFYATKAEAEAEQERRAAARQAEADATPEAMQRLEYSRKPYLRALEHGIRSEIEGEVRARVKSEIEAGGAMGDFTPGPWVASGSVNDDGVFSWQVDAPDLASTYRSYQIASGYGGLSSGFASKEQGPANAHLIAAAPDLLAFAETFLARIEDDGEPTPGTRWHAEYVAARAAVAKATGEKP